MSGFLSVLRDRLNYMVSLPERTLRSLASIAGGTTTLLTDTLFPEVLRGTTMYRIFVGDAQRFVIEKVAQIQHEGEQEAGQTDPQYVQKKMIGGALETAGLFAMHISPLWVFAIAGDAAAGTGVFLDRLVRQLKTNSVIPEETRITGLTDLLEAMQDTTRRSAAAIDTPPLSRAELNKLAEDMQTSYRGMFGKATNLVPRFDDLWNRMERLASRENVSLERLSGILTIDVAGWGRKGISSVWAVGQTGADLFGEKILDSYGKTLERVSSEGVAGFLNRHMKPFLSAAAGHFSPVRKTWTQSITGRIFGTRKEPVTPETVPPSLPVEITQEDVADVSPPTPGEKSAGAGI